jgi:hypothetical protein
MPRGVLGVLSKVALCGEPMASLGICGKESEIGTATVAAGSGSEPYWVSGPVYLTAGYDGAPFGLSVPVPAQAGPFNLGTVVVRSTVRVDPHTAQVLVQSDPLPTIRDGIPFRLKTINVAINRPGFIVNPTNCEPQAIEASVQGSSGAHAEPSVPFTVEGCRDLPFKPHMTALTHAKTSKTDGAYLHVKVTSGSGQANIGKVKVDLPGKLPSRLSTLQKACLAQMFEANPANCPASSDVGTATAVTPLLRVPLTGPAYIVSNAAAAFPDLEVVLQGEGVTVILDAETKVKHGITSSIFRAVPDTPVSSFDLVLPEGPHSILGAYGNLCKGSVDLQALLTGQNGGVVKEAVRIAVSNCPRHRPKAKRAGRK